MTLDQQLRHISDICRTMGADVRYRPEHGHMTVLAWESEGECHALSIQRQIQRQAAKYQEVRRKYQLYLRCRIDDGILKAALYFADRWPYALL